MSNYKTIRQSQQSFSFQHQYKIQSHRSAFFLTATQKRGLIGWLSSVLQPHDDEFMRAFKGSQRRGIVGLVSYITRNYGHLKQIVQYYIVALLIDYQWTAFYHEDQPALKQQNEIFLNILIQHLAARFYRESQWMTKIMHLPIYQIFQMLDKYSKGFITIRQLCQFCSISQLTQDSSKMQLLYKKLKSNLGGLQQKLYQQNLKELQYRVDLISFTPQNFKLFADCSQIYAQIFSILQQYQECMQQSKQKAQSKEEADNIQALQSIDINREDLHIKQLSKSLVQPKQRSPIIQSQKPNASRSLALSQTRVELSKVNVLGDSQELPAPDYQPQEENILKRQQIRQVADNQANKERKQQAKVSNPTNQIVRSKETNNSSNAKVESADDIKQKVLLKAAILSELQHIKFQKYHNRFNLFAYI